MCGRYTLHSSPEQIAELFDAQFALGPADYQPRYNIAPTTPAPVVRMADVGRVIELMRWGLVPHWSRASTPKYATFNARSEDAAEKASYRGPMRYRRCLVPVDGFYEWGKRDRGAKQPYLIRMADEQPFALAGLWDVWQDELQSFTILTTKANELMAKLHDRMPVVVDRDAYTRWLDPGRQDPKAVADVLRPFPSELMLATPVTPYVSNARNEGPRCIEPEQLTFFD